jgi:hypothetical protein
VSQRKQRLDFLLSLGHKTPGGFLRLETKEEFSMFLLSMNQKFNKR